MRRYQPIEADKEELTIYRPIDELPQKRSSGGRRDSEVLAPDQPDGDYVIENEMYRNRFLRSDSL
jgi:hypothetical protein